MSLTKILTVRGFFAYAFLYSFFSFSVAKAAVEVRNGDFVFECKSDFNFVNLVPADLVEYPIGKAAKLNLLKNEPQTQSNSELKNLEKIFFAVKQILAPIAIHQAEIGKRLFGIANDLFENTSMIYDLPQGDMDLGSFTPRIKNCDSAIRVATTTIFTSGKARLELNLNIWNKLDYIHRLTVILHEVLYTRLAQDIGWRDSSNVRCLTSDILSEQFIKREQFNTEPQKYISQMLNTEQCMLQHVNPETENDD